MEPTTRDYSLIGRDTVRAEASGLAAAEWYACPIERKQLKELMKRSDGPAIRDTIIWFAALIISAAGGVWFWGSWWAVPFFLVYGVLYGSSSDSRWHEAGHGTMFRTRWMNDVLYYVASFMILREPTVWRWSHTRHHTDTIIVGRDPEIAVPRPPDIFGILLNFFGILSARALIIKLFHHVQGKLLPEEKTYIPDMERPRVYVVARIYVAIYAAVIVGCLVTHSILPAMLIGLPSLYGAFLGVYFGLTQHAGLAEDVLDHRLNCRTVYMNPIFRFLYLNMNYHVEHHMFPMIPYHALSRLHAAIKDDCPTPYPSTIAAYREIIPALFRQRKDPRWHVVRQLPARAKPVPYNHETILKPAE